MTRGPADLRSRREQAGLSIEAVADATRIPVEHLRALEEGDVDRLPKGPYAKAYTRTLRSYYGMEPDDELPVAAPDRPSEPPAALPLTAVRTGATLSVLGLLALVAFGAWRGGMLPVGGDDALAPASPDQFVKLEARRTLDLKVFVDDAEVFDGTIAGGETRTFEGHDRIELVVSATGAARIVYNGRRIVPQGRQDAPRRLVFIDDEGSR